MQKHGVILDMSCGKLTFWLSHCQHSNIEKLAAPPVKKLASKTLKTNEPMKKKLSANNTLKYIIPARKAAAPKAATLQLLKVKQAKILKVILKASPQPRAKESARSTKLLKLAMIDAALFQYLIKQKGVEIFSMLMKKLEYQLNKTKKLVIDPATVVPEYYHKFLDVFSKKELDKISLHSKYDHKIELVNRDKDHGQAVLCGISKPQLKFVINFLEKNLKKGFIEASKASCSSPILLTKKLDRRIGFCVDYKKLNELTKKNVLEHPGYSFTTALRMYIGSPY